MRFPLVKTVTQHLRQQTPDGWRNSRSALELTMSITPGEMPGASPATPLPEAQSGGMSYRVEFQRIRLSQELPGQGALTYDSDASPLAIPVAIRPYHGLKNNGFQFRLNRDRQLVDVVGFETFLERCLQPVAPDQRAIVQSSLPVTSPADAVAFFVDESLGLIPAEVSQAGDNWLRSREMTQPVPCVATTRYTLRQVTSEVADVDIAGTIVPPLDDDPAGRTSADGVQVLIRGGQLLGHCRVDRRTGLPVSSHVEQSLEMTVRLADGTEFPQLKSTVTTLQPPADSREQGPITLLGGVQPKSSVRAEKPASFRK